MRKRFFVIALIVVIAAAFSWYAGSPVAVKTEPVAKGPEVGIIVGKQVPVFTLNSLEGVKTTVGKANKVTVINFWATWCPPCRQEMPELNRFWHKYEQSVDFYAVNIEEQPEKVKAFMDKGQYTMPVIMDHKGEVAKTFSINAVPTTVVVDKNGIIRYRKSGTVTLNELEGVINGL